HMPTVGLAHPICDGRGAPAQIGHGSMSFAERFASLCRLRAPGRDREGQDQDAGDASGLCESRHLCISVMLLMVLLKTRRAWLDEVAGQCPLGRNWLLA